MASTSETNVSYSQFACIGTGFSAVGLGATLKRWYGIDDIKFFEKHETLGGTWFISQYPGMSQSGTLCIAPVST
jgi:cation diffusion facilitator CzcD-associated flavoprotein CzcO